MIRPLVNEYSSFPLAEDEGHGFNLTSSFFYYFIFLFLASRFLDLVRSYFNSHLPFPNPRRPAGEFSVLLSPSPTPPRLMGVRQRDSSPGPQGASVCWRAGGRWRETEGEGAGKRREEGQRDGGRLGRVSRESKAGCMGAVPAQQDKRGRRQARPQASFAPHFYQRAVQPPAWCQRAAGGTCLQMPRRRAGGRSNDGIYLSFQPQCTSSPRGS